MSDNCERIMSIKLARELLDISLEYSDDIPEYHLRHQYRKYALINHPDKSVSPYACRNFTEIKSAFDFLSRYCGYIDDEFDDDFVDICVPSNRCDIDDYSRMFIDFVQSISDDMSGIQLKIFHMIIGKLSICCENSSLLLLSRIDRESLTKIRNMLYDIKDVIHISDYVLDMVDKLIREKHGEVSRVVLYPIIEDLFLHNVYILSEQGEKFIIPLWSNELVYEMANGCDLEVACIPLNPKNVNIDDNNNIIIYTSLTIGDIFNKDFFTITLGTFDISVSMVDVRLKREQIILVRSGGIPRINPDNVYDITVLSDLIIHLTLSLT